MPPQHQLNDQGTFTSDMALLKLICFSNFLCADEFSVFAFHRYGS